MHNAKKLALIFLIISVLLTIRASMLASEPKDFTKVLSFTTRTSDNVLIRGDVYIPKEIKKDVLAVFIHGFSGNRRYWKTMISAFVHDGYVCVAPDLRGHAGSMGFMHVRLSNNLVAQIGINYVNFEKDVLAAINWVYNNVMNFSSLLLIGHSMGGGLVIYLGYKWNNVKAVIAIAPALFGNYLNMSRPKNLLFIVGSNDRTVPKEYVMELFYNATKEKVTSNFINIVTEYDATRTIYIDDGSDHTSIVTDKDAVRLALNWADEIIYNISPGTVYYNVDAQSTAYTIASLASVFLLLGVSPLILLHFYSPEYKKKRELSVTTLLRYIMRAFIYPGFIAIFVSLPLLLLFFIPPFEIPNVIFAGLFANSLLMPLIVKQRVRDTFKRALDEIRRLKRDEIELAILLYLIFLIPLHLELLSFYPPSLVTSELRLIFIGIYAVLLLPAFMIDEIVFRGYIRKYLGDSFDGYILSTITYAFSKLFSLAVLAVIGFTLYFSLISAAIGGAFVTFYLAWMVVVIPDYFYSFSKNYRIAAIFNSLLIATMLAQFSAAIIPF